MSPLRFHSLEFRKEREVSWRELETLVSKAERSPLSEMTFGELSRLPVLYRGAVSSLSVARAIALDRNLLEYLENLACRAYIAVYGVRRHLGEAFAVFLARRFPQELRAQRWLLVIAAAVFALGVAAGWVTTARNGDEYYRLVPAALAGGRSPTSSREELRALLFDEQDTPSGGLATFASFLFTHNAQIAILCFGLGVVLGLPVFFLLFTNGQMLGALAALHAQRGLGLEFWGWVLPHGVSELSAVIICGAAGLMLARSLILPGRHGRLAALAESGRRAGLLVLGAVVMLLVAAGFEGFFRQLVHATAARLAVAAGVLALWLLYFTRTGRRAA